jgi:threonine synthase
VISGNSTVREGARHASALAGYRSVENPTATLQSRFNWRREVPNDKTVLEAVYDIASLRTRIDRDSVSTASGLWDWSFLLPVVDLDKIVSLHEGATPLIPAQRTGRALGLNHLYVKDESRNPTGSFKDRGASVTLSKCNEDGIIGVVVASSGNLAVSLATYASVAGLPFCGFIRDDTAEAHRLQCLATGQTFFVVEGGMLEGTRLAAEVSARFGLFNAVQPYNAFRIEGKKTTAFEICRDLGWKAPDRVLIPTSGCTNVLALYKGFVELQALGWIDGVPAIDVVQPKGCSPVVDAWRSNAKVQRSVGPGTALLGLGHPLPAAGDAAVEIVRRTGGKCLTTSDDAAYDAQKQVLSHEGVFLQPASVTPVAALADPENASFRAEIRNQVVVWIGTGTGKNQIAAPLSRYAPVTRITQGIEELSRLGFAPSNGSA